MKDIKSKAQELHSKVVQWRRYLHQNAELSFQEYKTQEFIIETLGSLGIECEKIAGTGVLAILHGENPSPTSPLVLRADIDALEIEENSGVDFACTTGMMHACGHDMHTANLLGTLALLKDADFEGTIWGLFQPGEELHPGGASIVLGEDRFQGITPRAFLALHCSPELEAGSIGVCAGQFMASTDEIHITVEGRGGHGAMPHLINDTVLASSAMVVNLQQIASRLVDPFVPTVISFGRIEALGATNVIPSKVTLEGTFRTMDEGWRAKIKTMIKEIASSSVSCYGCEAHVEIKDGYPSVMNDESLSAKALELGAKVLGEENALKIPRRMTAEDFGFYAAKYPSLMFRLGTGNPSAPLHNSCFMPDESSLETGVTMMATLALDILKQTK